LKTPSIERGLRLPRPSKPAGAFNAKLVIAKLDRLSRDAHFLLGLEKAGIEFVAVDMPHANRLTVGIMALVAEQERTAISERTKAALPPPREGRLGGVTLPKAAVEAV
jgi:DNA invertase Pin-like site-specific DNA recombinase